MYFGGGAQAGRKYQRIDRLYESVFPQKLGRLKQWLMSAFEICARYQEEHMSCGTPISKTLTDSGSISNLALAKSVELIIKFDQS